MKIAVTGVAGFIGSNLADRLLREGHDVVGIDNLAYGPREQIPEGVDFRQIDIRDHALAKQFTNCEAVFHLAAKNCIADCQDDPLETADINVTGTINVLRAVVSAGISRVIHAESSAVYEGSTIFPTPETEMAPRSFYAISKEAAGDFAGGFARFHGVALTGLRYFGVYGPRQDYRRTIPPLMSAFILALLRNTRPTIYGNGEKRRDFVYVDDINDFHMQCLRDERTIGETFNLGSGRPYSVNEIFAKIAAMLGSSLQPERKPDLAGEAQTTHADITKAEAIGWTPRVSLDDGLQRSVEFIRDHVIANLHLDSSV